MDLRPQANFGRYEIDTRIAQGGMAEVWLARSKGIDGFQKTVVLKTILPDLAEQPNFVKMFINEALLAARLNHPYIVQIFDLGEVDGSYYIAMEHVHGRTLRQIHRRCQKDGKLIPPWFVLRVMERVCEGLQYAFEFCDDDGEALELVHRDITPENIMVSFRGGVKILDFGVAKASAEAFRTQSGSLKGKYAYIPPEQIQGKNADQRGDIYAVGVTLYELLTGRRPFRAKNEFELLRSVLDSNPQPPRQIAPWMPKELEELVTTSMAKEPVDRYPSAGELGDEIHKFLLEARDYHGQKDLGLFTTSLFTSEADVRATPLSTPTGSRGKRAAKPDAVVAADGKEPSKLANYVASYQHADSSADIDEISGVEIELVDPVSEAIEVEEEQTRPLSSSERLRRRQDRGDVKVTGLEDWELESDSSKRPKPSDKIPTKLAKTAPETSASGESDAEGPTEVKAREPAASGPEDGAPGGKKGSWIRRLIGKGQDDPDAAAGPGDTEKQPSKVGAQPAPAAVDGVSARAPKKQVAKAAPTKAPTKAPSAKAKAAKAVARDADAAKSSKPAPSASLSSMAKPRTSGKAKPAASAKPSAESKPATMAKPATVAKPATAAKPATVAKPATLAKPTTASKSPSGLPRPATQGTPKAQQKEAPAASGMPTPKSSGPSLTAMARPSTKGKPAPEPEKSTPPPEQVTDEENTSSRSEESAPGEDKIASIWNAAPRRKASTSDVFGAGRSAPPVDQEEEAAPAEEPEEPPSDPFMPAPQRETSDDLGSSPFSTAVTDAFQVRRTSFDTDEDIFTSIKPIHMRDKPSSAHPFTKKEEQAGGASSKDDPWNRDAREGFGRSKGPEDEAAEHFERGLGLMKNGDNEGALEAWEEAIKLDPDNRKYRSNLKRLQKKLGDDDGGSPW